jgi:Glycosyl transferase family 2
MRTIIAPTPVEPVATGGTPSFSVIIAAYQAAGTVAGAVESALGQTSPPHEVIVCDDGSTDEIEGALDPLRDRIVFLRQENGGEGSAKNAAAGAAKGDFVAILDADDLYLPERLEALGELAAARPDLDILTTDAFLEVDGTVVRRCYDAGWTFEVDDQRGAILERNFVFGHAAVRRTRFLESGGFDPSIRYGTDWDLWCRMLLDGSRVGLVDEPLARYRLRPSSLSANRAALMDGRCRVLERAASRSDLTPDERRRVQTALATEQRNALLTRAGTALREGSPEARQLALRIARTRSVPARTRARAALAALAPRVASHHGPGRVALPGRGVAAAAVSRPGLALGRDRMTAARAAVEVVQDPSDQPDPAQQQVREKRDEQRQHDVRLQGARR